MSVKKLTICISEFLASASYTILSSFYPSIAISKGIPLWLIGIIFSIDPIVGLPVSVLVGRYMIKIGRRFILLLGMFFGALAIFLIGFLESASDSQALALSICSRIFAGIGAGCSMTAAPSILISEFPDETEKVIGLFEAASGLGLLAGPLIGSTFALFNISLSFFVTSALYILYIIATFFILSDLHPEIVPPERLRFRKIVFRPKLFLNFCAQMWLLFSLGYLSTIIELHLQSFGVDLFMVGIYYSVCTVTYFIVSLFEHKISNCFLPHLTVIAGIIGVGLAFLFIGPWEVFGHELELVVVGLGLLGAMGSLMYSMRYLVPTTGLMLRLASSEYGLENSDSLLDCVAAITNFFCNVGEVLGPFAAGFISESVGIENGCALVGVFTLGFAVVYVIGMWKCSSGERQLRPDNIVSTRENQNKVYATIFSVDEIIKD